MDEAGNAYLRASSLLELGRHQEAEQLIRAELAARPDNALALQLLVRSLVGQRRGPEAAAAGRHLVALRPDECWSFCLLSAAEHAADNRDAAQAAAHHATRLDPLEPVAWHLLAKTHPQLRAALAAANEAVRLAPLDPDYHNQAGIILDDLNLPHEARRAFLRALELDPGHAAALNNLATLDLGRGRLTKAASGLRASLAVDPQSQIARSNLDLVVVHLSWAVMVLNLVGGVVLGVQLLGGASWPVRAVAGVAVLALDGLIGWVMLRHLPPGVLLWGRGLWARVSWNARRILILMGLSLVFVAMMAWLPTELALRAAASWLAILRVVGMLMICWWVVRGVRALFKGE